MSENKVILAKNVIALPPVWYKRSALPSEQKELTNALFRLIEIKDMKTATHSKKVASYAVAIGREFIEDKETLRLLKHAALLHDIGKIMCDGAVLNKQGKLSDRDRLHLYLHPIYGMKILEGFHLDDAIVEGAWHHHERFDGTGYPDGLKGEEITLLTRIISAADIIDAMSTNRAYREGKPTNEIIDELDKAKGGQLDPDTAEATIELIEEQKIILAG